MPFFSVAWIESKLDHRLLLLFSSLLLSRGGSCRSHWIPSSPTKRRSSFISPIVFCSKFVRPILLFFFFAIFHSIPYRRQTIDDLWKADSSKWKRVRRNHWSASIEVRRLCRPLAWSVNSITTFYTTVRVSLPCCVVFIRSYKAAILICCSSVSTSPPHRTSHVARIEKLARQVSFDHLRRVVVCCGDTSKRASERTISSRSRFLFTTAAPLTGTAIRILFIWSVSSDQLCSRKCYSFRLVVACCRTKTNYTIVSHKILMLWPELVYKVCLSGARKPLVRHSNWYSEGTWGELVYLRVDLHWVFFAVQKTITVTQRLN